MGVIADYSADAGAAQKDDSDAGNALCPTCGQPMSADAIAKQAGFPVAAPAKTGKDSISATPPPPSAAAPKVKNDIIGVRG